jgi:hypothetical protein
MLQGFREPIDSLLKEELLRDDVPEWLPISQVVYQSSKWA